MKLRLVLIILLVMITTNISDNQGNFLISITTHQDTESDEKIFHNFEIPTTGWSNKTIKLSESNSYQFNELPIDNFVDFTKISGESDILKYKSNIYNMLNSSTGDINWEYNSKNFETKFSLNNSIYSHQRTITYNQAIDGKEILEIDITDKNFEINSSKMGWISIDLDTDEFWASFVLDYTSSYENFSSNSTGSVKFFKKDYYSIRLNLSDIAQIANTDLPSTLNQIEVYAYGNDFFDFRLNITQLSFSKEIETLELSGIEEPLSSGSSIQLIQDTSLLIKTNEDTTVELLVFRRFQLNSSLEGYFEILNTQLIYSGYSEIANLPKKFNYSFYYGSVFDAYTTNLTLEDEYYNLDYFEIHTEDEFQAWNVTGYLKYKKNVSISSNNPVQGKILQVYSNITGSKINGILYHVLTGELLQLNNSNDYWSGKIPRLWSNGEIVVFLWNSVGDYAEYHQNLILSPAILASENNYSINPARTEKIFIMLENATSSVKFKPQYVYSYYQGELYSFSNRGEIEINAGDFSTGSHHLIVNATHEGYTSVNFTLNLISTKMKPHVSITVERVSSHTGLITINIPEIDNWTLPVQYQLLSEGINKSGIITSISHTLNISNNDWEGNQSYPLEIYLGIPNVWNYKNEYQLEVYEEPQENLKNENKFLFLLGGVGSGLITLTFFVLKHYKNRMYTQTIQF